MERVASIDIGSTYTKGALFAMRDNRLLVERAAIRPTTAHRLSECFEAVLAELAPPDGTAIRYSSSAKGGLAISAIGVVPGLTLRMAYQAALTAGGRITDIFSYKLGEADLERLIANRPDVVLLSGGTDGGNEIYPLHNARVLAESALDCAIIYAGNKDIADEIGRILADKNVVVTANVLPDLDHPNPNPARRAIREVFLREIVHGKGLGEVIERAGSHPRPTPRAMLELVELISRQRPGFGDFCLIDMGGATTDFYSTNDFEIRDNAVLKGLPDPRYKRTVEGDLGMRVTAGSTGESAREMIALLLAERQLPAEPFAAYLERVVAETSYLPADEQECGFDAVLAAACSTLALMRHAGFRECVFTPDGERFVQYGKDLREVTTIIGTGGYLAKMANPLAVASYLKAYPDTRQFLVPERYTYYRDRDYLLPLLANAALAFPEAAAASAVAGLERLARCEPAGGEG